ncbi:MAG: hypothetical protein IJ597_08260 [Synergistaceae bacterium]|nr:hypothetical protein [Synergistaceae bacterium]
MINGTTTVRCPHCGTVKSGNTLRNCQTTCKGCGAVIAIDNEGNIKWTKPRN